MVKIETLNGTLVVDVIETFSSDHKDKAPTSACARAAGLVYPLSYYAQGTQVALASLGSPPVFEPLQAF